MNTKLFAYASAVILAAIPAAKADGPVSPAVAEATRSAFVVPTNVPGVYTSIDPPASFNPASATDVELAMFGYPPRPDSQASPQAYASWVRAMRASKVRVKADLEPSDVHSSPRRLAPMTEVRNGASYSTNWSGVIDFSGATSYNATSFHIVAADFVIPRTGVCADASGASYSSSWVGIDGTNSNDLLQAGTSMNENCTESGAQPSSTAYFAWVEWLPAPSYKIPSFAVNPGDEMFVEVWNTTPTQGYAYLVDYQQNRAITYSMTPPSGASLIGNSAEWILEAPTVNGAQSALANYISDYFSNCWAETWSDTYYYPGTDGAVLADLSTNGGSSGVVSFPTLEGNNAIWLQDQGSAR